VLKRLFGRQESRLPAAPTTVAEALDWAADRSSATAVIVLDPTRNHYVQFAAAGGSLTAEAVGNAYLRPEDVLDAGQERRLGELGYVLSGDGSGNWSQAIGDWPSSRPRVESLLLETMREVFGWTEGSPLAIQLIE
jgi:type III secretion system-like peptide-binding chaperone